MAISTVDLPSIALQITEALFNNKPDVLIKNQLYRIERLKRTGLRCVTLEGYLFIEQNPKKPSKWGELAVNGHKILWVIKGNVYLIRVQDGIVYNLKS